MSDELVSAVVCSTSRPAATAQIFSLLASDRQTNQVGLPRKIQTFLGMHLPHLLHPAQGVIRQVAQHISLRLPLAGISMLRQPFRFQASEKRSIGALSQQLPRRLMHCLIR